MNFFTHIFERFWLDCKLLFIVLLLGIISWKGTSHFKGERGPGVFQMGGDFLVKSEGVAPRGDLALMGRFSKKIVGWGVPLPCPSPLWEP